MGEFSVLFMFTSILLLISLSVLGLFWFISSQLSRRLEEKEAELERLQKIKGVIQEPSSAPTLKELADLTMRLQGRPARQESIRAALRVGSVTANGVEVSETQVKRIPLCFSYTDFMPDTAQLDSINKALRESLGPDIYATKTDTGHIRFEIRGEGFMYTGPVLLSARYHDIEQIMEQLREAASIAMR